MPIEWADNDTTELTAANLNIMTNDIANNYGGVQANALGISELDDRLSRFENILSVDTSADIHLIDTYLKSVTSDTNIVQGSLLSIVLNSLKNYPLSLTFYNSDYTTAVTTPRDVKIYQEGKIVTDSTGIILPIAYRFYYIESGDFEDDLGGTVTLINTWLLIISSDVDEALLDLDARVTANENAIEEKSEDIRNQDLLQYGYENGSSELTGNDETAWTYIKNLMPLGSMAQQYIGSSLSSLVPHLPNWASYGSTVIIHKTLANNMVIDFYQEPRDGAYKANAGYDTYGFTGWDEKGLIPHVLFTGILSDGDLDKPINEIEKYDKLVCTMGGYLVDYISYINGDFLGLGASVVNGTNTRVYTGRLNNITPNTIGEVIAKYQNLNTSLNETSSITKIVGYRTRFWKDGSPVV